MIKIKLNSKFYDKEVIEEALNDFGEVCSGKMTDDGVELEPKEDVKNLEEEFCNYVLGLMKNKTLV